MGLAYRRMIMLLGVLALTGGCSIFGTLEADEKVEPALIISYRDTMPIIVGDTVASGSDFFVMLETFGDYCTRAAVRTDVKITGRVAEIRPYNRKKSINNQGCNAELFILRHKPTLRVDTPGPLTIRVFGQNRFFSGNGDAVPVELTRTITVK